MKYIIPILGIGGFLAFLIYGSGGVASFSAHILSTQGGREEIIDLDKPSAFIAEPATQKTVVPKTNIVSPKKVAPCVLKMNDVPTHDSVIINEVAWMGSERDAKKEWIELKNISSSSILVNGWEVRDTTANIDIRIERMSLSGGEVLVLRRGTDFTGTINNSEESLSLFDTQCTLVDLVVANSSWPAGDSKNEFTAERGADFNWYTSAEEGGTMGKENSALITYNKQLTTTTEGNDKIQISNDKAKAEAEIINVPQQALVSEIRISEVMTGKKGNANFDFIELYNNSDVSVSLSGWSIKKKSSTGNESTLVSASRLEGKVVAPHGYFLLVGGGYSGSPTADVVWPNSYSLSGSNNGIILYMKSTPIDAVEWDKINENESIVREGWNTSSYRREVNPIPQNTQSQ